MTAILIQMSYEDIQGRRSCEDEDRELTLATGQWTRTAGNHQKLGKKPGADSPSETPEGINLANTLLWTSGLLEPWERKICCLKPPILW